MTEISQIVLVLLDSRCPTLHFPPALSWYLANVPNAARLRTVLVLTKVDIAGPERAAAWAAYLRARHPGMRVVQVESYTEKSSGPDASSSTKKRMHEPHLPSAFRQTLVDALRDMHAELLQPPPAVRDKPERLANWQPRVRSQVDWEAVRNAHGGQVGTVVGGAAAPRPNRPDPDDAHTAEGHTDDEDSDPEFLTIGLIGEFACRLQVSSRGANVYGSFASRIRPA